LSKVRFLPVVLVLRQPQNAGRATDVYPNRVKELGRKPSAS
jgi:hypothetical protein